MVIRFGYQSGTTYHTHVHRQRAIQLTLEPVQHQVLSNLFHYSTRFVLLRKVGYVKDSCSVALYSVENLITRGGASRRSDYL